ncbi:hypothetical protein BofuT4_uP102160.1 [Botrytis cinerea T4]|uniref:Uncharacterized protein n=1 Tax=Botryotinia fuckeliana (strain T4) TaxID=999810 RepID=G2YBC4_BOTF4|nr:hypothetical protein BofuT4_uP102160.1 [Botrytis cinerea T4]
MCDRILTQPCNTDYGDKVALVARPCRGCNPTATSRFCASSASTWTHTLSLRIQNIDAHRKAA